MKLTRRRLSYFIAAIIFCLYFGLSAGNTKAAGTVINTNDAGAGSLRAAMVGGGTVTFNIPTGSSGCVGTVCNIALTSSLAFDPGVTTTIDGTLNNTMTITGGAFRVFNAPNNGARTVNLIRLTITGGNASQGGGIGFFSGGAINITDCTVSGNNATGSGGQGGGFYLANAGAANNTITNSTFSGNTANGSNAQGGGVWTAVGLTISNSTFSGNNNNGNNGNGGGLYVNNSGPTVTINYSTFTLNTSTGNVNNGGGGIYSAALGGTNLRNTIIAQNTTTGTGPDANGTFVSNGNNLIGAGTPGGNNFANTPAVNGDQAGTLVAPLDARLGALANNGGATPTHALLTSGPASPAIDKGKRAVAGVPASDQRGFARLFDNPAISSASNAGDNTDIGAFEVQAVSAAAVSLSGRVANAAGLGLSGVTVALTGGPYVEPVYARTSPFGYYSFSGITAGQVYIITVSSKTHTFNPSSQVFDVLDSVTDADFVSQE